MKRHILPVLCIAILAVAILSLIKFAPARGQTKGAPQGQQTSGADEHTLSGPYTHKNLTIFLIHGEDKLKGKQFLTLQEALEQKKVIVHETKDVNNLTIENTSREQEVYVQSGEIVKGGQQDRVLSSDLILPPQSGKVPIAAFCVEQGRWQQRGQEASTRFSNSTAMLASKDLKVAANHTKSQAAVWSKVTETQGKLSKNIGAGVVARESASSLQLTLESRKVQENIAEYTNKLSPQIVGKGDTIGYLFALNGKVNSADTYASHALFQKLWPKLIKAAATEAVAESSAGERFDEMSLDIAKSFLLDAERGRSSENTINKRIKVVTTESDQNLLFETRDQTKKGAWVHRSYLAK